jgi:hypothetical protein
MRRGLTWRTTQHPASCAYALSLSRQGPQFRPIDEQSFDAIVTKEHAKMLLKLILPIVCFAAFRFIMFSDNPDLVELRAQIYVAVLERAATVPIVQDPNQTELQKLHARVAAEETPCTDDVCLDEGSKGDQIRSALGLTAESPRSFEPKFISVRPKN